MSAPNDLRARWSGLAEEVRLLGRISVYALFIGTVYWFVSYEVAGTVLLVGFGVGTGAGFVVLWRGSRTPARTAQAVPVESAGPAAGRAADPAADPDGPFGDESGAIPGASIVPLEMGFGITVMALGLVFGLWLTAAGLIPFLAGAWSWLHAVGGEIPSLGEARDRRS